MAEQQWKPFTLTHITYPADVSVYAPILALLSLLPPFGVCALTTATVIYKDVIAAYLLIGSLFSAVTSAILKKLIQEPRPDRYDDDDDDVEFGMPSNHSCFAWFCCTFVMMYVVKRGGVWAATTNERKTSVDIPGEAVEFPAQFMYNHLGIILSNRLLILKSVLGVSLT
ncbi:hypothetical protein QTG54_004736 [Skeletonema marinoi]|uniref:Phosphatidic acid phosphatase type 2/haloperoxidase domain-containing protein n=1 Tax=Skeletonema marinoi TaxID=267567 RepID=A0AAD8YDF4_9STRA|nr:hypothetical protein QTG54_004736 [Skeletonema marinoi]